MKAVFKEKKNERSFAIFGGVFIENEIPGSTFWLSCLSFWNGRLSDDILDFNLLEPMMLYELNNNILAYIMMHCFTFNIKFPGIQHKIEI